MAENTQADVKKLSFERAIRGARIDREAAGGRQGAARGIGHDLCARRGAEARCEELLRQAEARVDKITTDANGQVTGTEPLDVQ